MKRTIIFLVAALALPTSVALAKGNPNKGGRAAPRVQYVLRGTLSAYTPASDSATGSITIAVKHANYHGHALKNQSLTFILTTDSRVRFRRGSHADHQIADGTRSLITGRAPRKITGDLATELPTLATRLHVLVLKAPATP